MSEPLKEQLEHLTAGFGRILGANLVGIYLHGSLAMGCFNPALSDLDLLVRVCEPIGPDDGRSVIDCLFGLSGTPAPIELSILSDDDLFPWRYPTPYTLHFSEDWRERFESGEGQPAERLDHDLAAHITVLHARGTTLLGPPPSEVFPSVPENDYLDSILRDAEWALERLHQNPVYAVLNHARVHRYLVDRAIVSKLEAGEWALATYPVEVQSVIAEALRYYRGDSNRFEVDPADLERFVAMRTGFA